EFVGEHLLAGKVGNFFVIFSFCSALLAAISYFFATQKNDADWKTLGRISFLAHGVGILGIISTLFFMILNQYFEYYYVWQHSSTELPLRYIFSCFWEGQEGSFLLWAFWHMVIGVVFLFIRNKWEAPVLSIFGLVQAFLMSMLLGVYFFEYRLGSNPFTALLREHPDFSDIPLFTNPNYLENLDGRGLNPLLQNYWMTIHPPTLFLGFASTLLPFALAISGLWTKQYKEWLKTAIPWTFFSIFILAIGILMGGAWAYEALSFGGFWAWDPVENASLVPWLTLVGAGHLMIVEQRRGGVMKSLLFLTFLTFILVLYSSFLTRSGVLGDASVHAFTDLGMSGQLLLYLLTFVAISIFIFVLRYKHLPSSEKEEELWSREFWMFIGALVLFISSFQITISTSIPVINKIFGSDLAPPVDAIEHYNSWQVPFVIVILLLMGFSQFFNYKKTEFKKFFGKIFIALLISAGLAVAIGLSMQMFNPFHLFMLFSALFAAVANLDYLIRVMKGKIRFSGASISHAGFGIMMLGALLSMGKQEIISNNTSSYDVTMLGENYDNQESILLMKDDTLQMGDYLVSYVGKEKEGVNIKYNINYYTKNDKGELTKEFTLKPQVQLNDRMGNVPEPDTRHFLFKDIYTHVTWAVLEENKDDEVEKAETQNLHIGDTVFLKRAILIVDSLKQASPIKHEELMPDDIAVEVALTLWDFDTKAHKMSPVFVLRDSSKVFSIPSINEDLGISISFDRIYPNNGSIDLTFIEKKSEQKEFIVMQAVLFPYINLLWLGCLIMSIGIIISIRNSIRIFKK
ncbi:MAG: heme lyase CcmF/NrfE family subunit, partial [Flavobacteriales bacterium]